MSKSGGNSHEQASHTVHREIPLDCRHSRRFRYECLGREMFLNLREARVVISDWRLHYNQERPHSRLGYRSPNEFINTKTLTS